MIDSAEVALRPQVTPDHVPNLAMTGIPTLNLAKSKSQLKSMNKTSSEADLHQGFRRGAQGVSTQGLNTSRQMIGTSQNISQVLQGSNSIKMLSTIKNRNRIVLKSDSVKQMGRMMTAPSEQLSQQKLNLLDSIRRGIQGSSQDHSLPVPDQDAQKTQLPANRMRKQVFP